MGSDPRALQALGKVYSLYGYMAADRQEIGRAVGSLRVAQQRRRRLVVRRGGAAHRNLGHRVNQVEADLLRLAAVEEDAREAAVVLGPEEEEARVTDSTGAGATGLII